MKSNTGIWVFVLIFMTLTSFIVIADDLDLLPTEEPIQEDTIKNEIIIIDEKTEQDNPNIKDNLDGYERSEIDCIEPTKGKFHIYKEGELDKDLYINCNDAKNDKELKDLINLEINKEVEEYKAIRGIQEVKPTDIRLEKVRLKK